MSAIGRRAASRHKGAVLLLMIGGMCSHQSASAEGSLPANSARADAGAQAAASLATVRAVVEAYEVTRAHLASYAIDATTASAAALQKAAVAALSEAPKPVASHLEGVASAAAALGRADAKQPQAVRRAFGEVSRHVVGLLAAAPALQAGLRVFKCPMAKEYKKWVQRGRVLSNPYMGKRMPTCGVPSDWK